MMDPVFELSWPRRLFDWEAKSILQDFGSGDWVRKVEQLLREAYHDDEVANYFGSRFAAAAQGWPAQPGQKEDDARDWFVALLADETRLRPYREPVYWAERNSDGTASTVADLGSTFPRTFLGLVNDLSQTGYFPKVLPVPCVDDYSDLPDARLAIRKATKLDIPWPMNGKEIDALPEPALYSLVEYFHDQAMRPRSSHFHSFNQCGLHYDDFNVPSGRIVYRWKVNALLVAHNMPLRLGSTAEEQGRLFRHFSSPLDDLATEQVARRAEDPGDEVAHAVRMYRNRNATIVDKRAAIALLAGEMEPRRRTIERKISAGDEADLFRIANKFTIRHRDKAQQSDYGEEFLDWVFWTYVATVRLLDDITQRQAVVAESAGESA